MKGIVHHEAPNTISELMINITHRVASFEKDTLKTVYKRIENRLCFSLKEGSGRFKHVLNLNPVLYLRLVCNIEHQKVKKTFGVVAFKFRRVSIYTLIVCSAAYMNDELLDRFEIDLLLSNEAVRKQLSQLSQTFPHDSLVLNEQATIHSYGLRVLIKWVSILRSGKHREQ